MQKMRERLHAVVFKVSVRVFSPFVFAWDRVSKVLGHSEHSGNADQAHRAIHAAVTGSKVSREKLGGQSGGWG